MDVAVTEDELEPLRLEFAPELLGAVEDGADAVGVDEPEAGVIARDEVPGINGGCLGEDVAHQRGGREVEALDRESRAEPLPEPAVVDGAQRGAERDPLPVGHRRDRRVLPVDERVEDGVAWAESAGERGRAVGERGDDGRDAGVGEGARHQLPGVGDRVGATVTADAEIEEVAGTVLGADIVDGGAEIEAEGEEGDLGGLDAVVVAEAHGEGRGVEVGVATGHHGEHGRGVGDGNGSPPVRGCGVGVRLVSR